MGYTAPSVDGQAEAISAALRHSGVDPATISYVEAHGTGTRVGDPIEFAALERVFRTFTDKKQFCAIGSVKSNIGHLDTAAGIAGLIKTVLALQHQKIPASLGFETPNPLIDFASSPFYVNDKLAAWESSAPRRAGVSSFGIGGTNAHVILEEAPIPQKSSVRWPNSLLVLSAKSAPALEQITERVAGYLSDQPEASLADVCHTLQVGRQAFPHRRALVCSNREDALSSLTVNRRSLRTYFGDGGKRAVTFMFSGQGSQYPGMARGLYETQPTFRRWFDVCAESLQSGLGCDLRQLVYSSETDANTLNQTRLAQAALFSLEYSLARMWMSWGVQPDSMIGHSIGEYVAACLAGVFSLEDALRLVEARGRIMQANDFRQYAGRVSSAPAITRFDKRRPFYRRCKYAFPMRRLGTACGLFKPFRNGFRKAEIECRLLHTSHAFHSSMMDDALAPFLEIVRKVKLNEPRIPFISNLTGKWIRSEDATNPAYWPNHLRQTVQFRGWNS